MEIKPSVSMIKVEETYFGTDSVLSKERKDIIDEFKTKIQSFDLKKQKWYIIKFQTYCKTDEDIHNCHHVLAEVKNCMKFKLYIQ
jgi:hypothetical protein